MLVTMRISRSDLTFPLRRYFLALPLEDEAKWQFQALQEELREFEDCLRFQNPQSPHLTLQFWSEIMEIEYDQISRQVEIIAEKAQTFTLSVTEAGTFGNRQEDRVLYLDIAFSEELARLKKSCPWPSEKPFTPHLTLARVKHPQRFVRAKKQVMKLLKDCAFEIPVDRIRAYAEIGGIKQTEIGEFVFGS
jgi:2'-5' RNA ligase